MLLAHIVYIIEVIGDIYTHTVSVRTATTAFTYAACHVRPLLYNKGTRDIYLC